MCVMHIVVANKSLGTCSQGHIVVFVLCPRNSLYTYVCCTYFYRVIFVTFRVKHSQGEMYSGHGRLCVCVSVCLLCLSPHSYTTARTRM